MQVLIIADDLTGALDSSVMLAGAGLRCTVARRPADVAAALGSRPDVLAVSTASREGSAEAARRAVAAALQAVGPLPRLIFKKVDSRLKGHLAVELAAVGEASDRREALASPAVPAQGRRTVGGQLKGTGVAAPIDVAAAFAGSGVALVAPDAATDEDLDAALAAALDARGEPPLLVGAAGLAGALARRLAPVGAAPEPRLEMPMLLAIGSRDPITLAQVAALETRGDATQEAAPDGVCPAPAERELRLIRLTSGEGAFDPAQAGERFAAGIAALAADSGAATLFACGGESVDAILGALRVGVLEVEGEALPGVPVSRMVAAGRTMRLVTKSGGFGAPDALVTLVNKARAHAQESAG